uniref:Uncharacterized protein n=1 Tax=Panagrolaimus sp. PS1159 TaxID=55785 RepID=A0AC35FB19_9BILA
MNTDYLKTIHGMISILQIILGFVALCVGVVLWHGGNVFILIFPWHFPGLIFVFPVILVTWAIALGVTAMQVMDRAILENMGKIKMMMYHGILLVLLVIAAGVETYYVTHYVIWDFFDYEARLTIDTVLLWILVISHIGQLIFVGMQK